MRLIGAGSHPDRPQVDHDLIFTVPNILTVLRFMGVPLFVWLVLSEQEYGFAVLLVPDAILAVASLIYFRSHPDLPVSIIGKIRTALLLVGTPLLVLSKLPVPLTEVYFVAAWTFLGFGLVGHWIAAYNYFWAILRKGKELKSDDGGHA
jgi:phosphatidylglycerophosphate synthase